MKLNKKHMVVSAAVVVLPLVVGGCEYGRVGLVQSPVYFRSMVVSTDSVVNRAARFNQTYDGMCLHQVAVTQQELLVEGGRIMHDIQSLQLKAETHPELSTFYQKLAELCEQYRPVSTPTPRGENVTAAGVKVLGSSAS